MDYETVVTAGAVSIFLMQGLKWIIRKIKKDMEYSFPEVFYAVGIPVLNIVTPFAILWMTSQPMPIFDVVGIVKQVLFVALGSLISFFGYDNGLKPLTDYGAKLAEDKKAKG
jgi:hypothetical protein